MYPALKLQFEFQKQQQPPEPKHDTRNAKESHQKARPEAKSKLQNHNGSKHSHPEAICQDKDQ